MLTLLFLTLLGCGDLCSPQAAVWYETLLAEGGYGHFDRERAAFLIRERDGTLTLQPWPNGGHRHATYRGVVPPRTIALLHTHPKHEPLPSAQDRSEAKRLALPVVVITPEGAIAAFPTSVKTPTLVSRTTRAPAAPRTSLRR